MRQSKTNWSDCVVIQRKCHVLGEAMMTYAAGGFQKQGLKDDQMVIVAAIELRNKLNELIERKA
jgi:hypothetical protein